MWSGSMKNFVRTAEMLQSVFGEPGKTKMSYSLKNLVNVSVDLYIVCNASRVSWSWFVVLEFRFEISLTFTTGRSGRIDIEVIEKGRLSAQC